MRWRKLGRIYKNPELHEKLLTHCANPVPHHLEGDVFRIFFSARDADQRSSVGAVDIDIVTKGVVREFFAPIFKHGPSNSFYSHGVSLGNIFKYGNNLCIGFMGWHVPVEGHWVGEIGRLVLEEDLSLTIGSRTPYLALDQDDPVSLSYPWIEKADDIYHMWYGSTITWDAGNNEMLHVLKYANSADGLIWNKTDIRIPYEVGIAQAFSRPTLTRDINGVANLWFSYRAGNQFTYRIGVSSQLEAGTWSDVTPVYGLEPTNGEWDSDMQEYPYVFDHKGELYMLYNGNGYGESGFGLAILERDND